MIVGGTVSQLFPSAVSTQSYAAPVLWNGAMIGALVLNGGVALSRLAVDPSLCRALGEAGRRRVAAVYSSSQMIGKYAALMQQTAA